MGGFRGKRRRIGLAAFLIALPVASSPVHAGGGPENVFLLIDPLNNDSKFVGNYYKQARNIPDRNVIYLKSVPTTGEYADFAEKELLGFLGMTKQRGVDDHIDYVVIPPGGGYRLSAPGYISDSCFAVSNFSASSLYTMSYLADSIIDNGMSSASTNHYYTSDDVALAFDSNIAWWFGDPSDLLSAKRYYIGAMLGYSGTRGNTLQETLDMIDRSVAADGSFPSGTFYYMETNDAARSDPRDGDFAAAINSIEDLGGAAVEINDWLPDGQTDILGIMTGFSTVDIDGATDITILDGAFCDHLTSFAGYFDDGSQTKMSEWIRKGASGTCGTVEEPCNYPGKFPHPRMHVYYYQGLSLGEAQFRSLNYVPFQVLLYGDPLTQPFAYIPVVTVKDAPSGPVSGTITLTPTASTSHPTADIAGFDLLVDGVLLDSIDDGNAFALNTALLADGPHDVRVIAYEDSGAATQGRWAGTLTTANHGRSVTVSSSPAVGDLDTLFNIDVSVPSAGELLEIRLRHNGRVVAATSSDTDEFPLYGQTFGGGLSHLVAEAEFDDGTFALSGPFVLDIANTTFGVGGPRGGNPAIAYSYHLDVPVNEGIIVDLPGTDLDDPDLLYTVIDLPAQATVLSDGPTRIVIPDALAEGEDTLTFLINAGPDQSDLGTVTLRYRACLPPIIQTQPVSLTACYGGSATFSVEAEDADSYQWFANDVAIDGATDSTLVLTALDFPDAGEYRVDITSVCGTPVSSDTVTLTLDGNFPFFTLQPTNTTVSCGGTTVLTAAVQGYFPPTLQWQLDGVDILGATSSFLIIFGADLGDAGVYQLLATNQCGTAYSNPATLTVTGCAAPPSILSAGTVLDHAAEGDLSIELPLAGLVSDSRLGGGSKIVVTFDQAMNETIAEDSDNISVVGVNNGVIDSNDVSASLAGGTTLTITFPGLVNGALTDGDSYTIDLSLLENVAGDTVGDGSDADVRIRVLAGDSNDDGAVDPLDSGSILARFGDDVAIETTYDVNADGFIDPLDVGAVLARFGNSAPD